MPRLESKLLDIFMKHQGSYLTSQDLAKSIESSDRTVRKYIGLLNDELQGQGALIIAKQGYGYTLEISNSSVFNIYYAKQRRLSHQFTDVTQLSFSEDRQRYILNKLFLEGKRTTSKEFAQELYLSKTRISHILSEVKELLLSYDIILQNHRTGIEIIGHEGEIRHFIKDYFFADTFQQPVFSLFEEEILDKAELSEIISIVIDEIRNTKLFVSDYIIHNLVIHIALMVKRVQLGNNIIFPQKPETPNKNVEYRVASRIVERLNAYFELDLPAQEVDFITLHLIGISKEKEYKTLSLRDSITVALLKLAGEIGLDISVDNHLIVNIQSHIEGLLSRLENGIQLSNPIKESILSKYSSTVGCIAKAFEKIDVLSAYEISEDEWVYLSLHILATLEKRREHKVYRTLVVCATGIGSARFLKNRIEKLFKDKIVVEKVSSCFELSDIDLSQFDLIISSIDLSNMFLLIPVISVNILLEEDDVKRIETFLNIDTTAGNFADKEIAPETNFNVKNFFEREQFFYLEEEISKDHLLTVMISKLSPRLDKKAEQNFKQQVLLRENLGAMVFNDILAFPHPAKALTSNEQIVICVSKYPISWDEQHQKVQLIFLISPSVMRNEQIKQLSPILANFAEDKEKHQKLLAEPTFEKFLSLL